MCRSLQKEKIMTELAGKRALVTGGSRGIGAAIALALAKAGADVAITFERNGERADEVRAAIEAEVPRAAYAGLSPIHSRAPFFAAQAAVRHMQAGGRIISIGTNMSSRVAAPG